MVFLCDLIHVSPSAVDLFRIHITCTLAGIHIMSAYLRHYVFRVIQFDDFSARHCSETEPVSHHECSRLFYQTDHIHIVNFRSDHNDLRPPVLLCIRLSGLQLFQCLFQLINQHILWTDIRCQRDHMILISGNSRILFLPKFANLADQITDLVMVLYRLPECFFGNVDAVHFMQWCQNLSLTF